MEIAKMRAARLLWARIVSEFNPSNPKSSMLRTHSQTSGWSLTEQDPHNNIIRTTIEALSAVFGGTQSLHTNSMDEAIALPTEFSARIARNTQLIIQEESGITNVIDPWGGSYMMESLTAEIAAKAWSMIEEIEAQGGMVKAIESGMPKLRIEEAAARKQARIDLGEEVIVGVNKYQAEEDMEVDILDIDNEAVLQAQLHRLSELKQSRDTDAVTQSLEAIHQCAMTGEGNLLDLAIKATRVRATVGEISMAMEKEFGRYNAHSQTVSGIYGNAYQHDEDWQRISSDISAFVDKYGRRPRMLVCKMGQDGHDRGAKVIATAFADVGFDIDLSPMFSTPEEVARQAIENDVHVVGVSSQAAGHKSLVPGLIEELKQQGASEIIVVVGGVIPKQDYDFLTNAGVKGIFGPGTRIPISARSVLDAIQEAHHS
jgi:methylmalonyl-CoA mutase